MDKQRIKQSFSKSAADYDRFADVQLEMMASLVESLPELEGKVLDIGSGTGLMARLLIEKFPELEIVAADLAPGMIEQAKKNRAHPQIVYQEADGENLPFADQEFNCVLSSASLQWMAPDKVFAQVKRVLKPGGQFYFTTFGPQTLIEIKKAGWPVNQFYGLAEIESKLQSYFPVVQVSSKLIKQQYRSVYDLLTTLKAIGSRKQGKSKSVGLLTKKKIQTLLPLSARGIDVSYEVLFGLAQK